MNPLYSQRSCSVGGLTALGAGLLLAGCAALPPKSDLKPVAAPDSYATRQSFAAAVADWPSDRWWNAFGDPQLDTVIEEGLAGATDLRVAQARLAKARAAIGEARSALLPSVGGAAEGGITQQSDNYLFPAGFAPRGWPDYGQATLNLSWQIDFFGGNRAALAAARSEAEAAGAEAAAARLSVSTAIASTYADLADLHAQRDAAENAVKVRARTHELMRGRQAQGLENTGAVGRAASSLASAEGDLAALDESIALARNALAALMGAGPDRGLAIARPSLAVAGSTALPGNLPADLIGRRPDVIAARLHAEAAASRIKQARAAFYPNVNLTALVGLQALGIGDVFKSGSDFGTAGPAVSLPIFEGGKLRSQYRGAEADYQTAVAQYDGALVQALREVADAQTSRRALGTRLDKAEAAERAAEAAWTVANNRYRGGLATYLDVLVAEDALIATRRTTASLKTRAFSLEVALIRALGGGYRS